MFGILYNNCDQLKTTNHRLNVKFTTRNRIIITHVTCHSWYFTWYRLRPNLNQSKVTHFCTWYHIWNAICKLQSKMTHFLHRHLIWIHFCHFDMYHVLHTLTMYFYLFIFITFTSRRIIMPCDNLYLNAMCRVTLHVCHLKYTFMWQLVYNFVILKHNLQVTI